MQMRSSARAKYGAPRSASLKTATTSTPRSRQARITRRAISPRLATRMRWNMTIGNRQQAIGNSRTRARLPPLCYCLLPVAYCLSLSRGIDREQHLPVLDRLLVLDEDADDGATALGGDFVEDLHRLDDADDRVRLDLTADLDERLRVRVR